MIRICSWVCIDFVLHEHEHESIVSGIGIFFYFKFFFSPEWFRSKIIFVFWSPRARARTYCLVIFKKVIFTRNCCYQEIFCTSTKVLSSSIEKIFFSRIGFDYLIFRRIVFDYLIVWFVDLFDFWIIWFFSRIVPV